MDLFDPRDHGPDESDALAHADSLDEGEYLESEDLMLRCGFGCTTGVDSAMNHEGMLAIGLAMQEEFA